ncbi:MAG TPA: biotin--[acetyl-CoA-carboxylase] ligase [Gemmatimonadales bacterium]|nr:biotin--[acetyl-CoA-carboxylase] ligase [Gemmatimonadales bacterium]
MAGLTLDGVPAARLAERWGLPQVGCFRTLASALDAVHELAAQGAPAGTVVLAEEQTAGRGRDGRTWRSPAGGVWLGALLRPGGGALPAIAVRVGLAVAEAVDGVLGRPVTRLKWPNDVLLQDRKLGGILCEGRWQGDALQWLAVGVGVNLANEIPAELGDRAIALREVLPAARRIDLLDRLVPALFRGPEPGAPLTEAELAAFGERDWLRGRQLARPVFGRAAGIGPDGALLVVAAGATVAVRQGHVELA